MALFNRLRGPPASTMRAAGSRVRPPSSFARGRTTAPAALAAASATPSSSSPRQHRALTTPCGPRWGATSTPRDPALRCHAPKTGVSIDHAHGRRQRRWGSGASDGGSDAYAEEQRKRDHEHCVEMVRARDMEGYLCGLLMPPSAREAYFALRAFNVEIASVKDSSQLIGGRSRGSRFESMGDDGGVGEPSLASRLRMQWWRDAVAGIYDRADDVDERRGDSILDSLASSGERNPTLRSLGLAIRTHGLTHRFLRRMVEAREADLKVAQYERVRDVAQYGEDTVSSLLYLNLECAGVRDEAADMVASDVGVGLGLLTALRSTGFRAAQGECSIPSDLASKYSISMDTLWSAMNASIDANDINKADETKSSREALRNAAVEMADAASFHLHRARDKQSNVPKAGRPCLLPAVCGLRYLDSLKGVNYDVLHPSLVGGGENAAGVERSRRLGLMFLLGRTWLTGTF